MIGHGGPRTSRERPVLTAGFAAACRGVRRAILLCLLLCLGLTPSRLTAETMRVRIAWGGGGERLWDGTISVDREGTLSQPRPLGIEADEPGSMWIEQGQLVIRPRSARAFDAVDVSVTAPWEASLQVQFRAADDPDHPLRVEIPLVDLISGFYDKPLDDNGNRLQIRRTPGDKLRVRPQRDALIFSPGEVFRLTLEPHLFCLAPGSKVQIKAELIDAGGREMGFSAEHQMQADQPVTIPWDVVLPLQEGVYDLVITAQRPANWQQAVPRPLRPQQWNRTVAQRRVQVLVLGLHGRVPSMKAEGKLSQVVEIDPANPKWHEKLGLDRLPSLAKIPRLWTGPVGNGNAAVRDHALGKLIQLSPSGQSPDVSWEAYTLPIDRPGRPHVLEVEYPSDLLQTLGISILEPNAAGALMPLGLDSGVDSSEEVAGEAAAPRWLRHRLIFWPRTTAPMVLMTNRRNRAAAAYGKIRVLAGWEHLPRAPTVQPEQDRRLWLAYLDRPLFPENFSARESLDFSGRSLDDWTTFYQGGTRLVEYLQHVGYQGLMISVLADGSTIYPSKILEPTPRYDTGIFFATAQDPVRKDVLEMLLRLFDREGLQLIPMIDFAAPLPKLEAIRREGGPAGLPNGPRQALEWIGPDGATWCQTHPTRRALAPYYNVLQPVVQEAMLEVVREMLERYAHHKSFAGLAIRLSGHGYAQLPGPAWGMDDATIARFQQDTNVQVPGTGPLGPSRSLSAPLGPSRPGRPSHYGQATDRFARRAEFLQRKRSWLEWRSGELSRFYQRLHDELTSVRPGARLYLAGAAALAAAESQAELRPTLPQSMTMEEALLRIGIDARHYPGDQGLVLLRPERLAPTGSLNARAVDLEINQLPDVDDYFQRLWVPGSLFFHQPQEVRIESFDQKSPFKSTYTWLAAQPVPSGRQNRRRFVHSLATLDSQVLLDGGWMLPMGQEESIRDLVAAYRRLPAVRFRRVGDGRGANSSQPVTFRYATHAKSTYLYAVNDAPFATTARVRVDAPPGSRLVELTGARQVAPLKRDAGGMYWMVELQPYDLVAVKLLSSSVARAETIKDWRATVQISRPQVSLPETVENTLRQRILELADRAASLGTPPPLRILSNPGFEEPGVRGQQGSRLTGRAGEPTPDSRLLTPSPIPGWVTSQGAGVVVRLDQTQKHGGKQSVKLATSGPRVYLVSRPFEPPSTGRLAMSVWLRVANAAVQPSLQVVFEGNLHGERYSRWFEIGRSSTGEGVGGAGQVLEPIRAHWAPYVFPLNDLPLEGLSELRVRFDLSGPGELWIDDVQLFHLAFSAKEINELTKLLQLAHVTLQNGKVGDCVRLLEGYWPRFLEANVPLRPAVGQKPRRRPVQSQPPTRSPGMIDRVRGLLPKPLRF